jgi:hypothetical protein
MHLIVFPASFIPGPGWKIHNALAVTFIAMYDISMILGPANGQAEFPKFATLCIPFGHLI